MRLNEINGLYKYIWRRQHGTITAKNPDLPFTIPIACTPFRSTPSYSGGEQRTTVSSYTTLKGMRPPLYLNVYSLLSLPFPCPSSLLLRIISFTIFPFQNTYTPYTSFDSSLPIREATIDPIKSKPLPPVFTFYPHRFHIVPYSCTLDHH